MFNEYPGIYDLFCQVTDMLETVSTLVGAKEVPPDINILFAATVRYERVMMSLSMNLVFHPEWLEQLERLMIPVGCPAQKVPLIEKFLADKGAELL